MSHSLMIQKSVLDGGIRLVTERIPRIRSAALGVWVEAGVINERREHNGISHFVEHMVFKGTPTRGAFAIVHAIESRGGILDAFTDRDVTCFYIHCLKEDLSLAIDLIGDMISHPLFGEEDIVTEKRVILDEIASILDIPEEWIHDAVASSLWGDHPIGYPVLGTVASISSFSQHDLFSYLRQRYCNGRVIVVAAGNVDHDRTAKQVMQSFRLPHHHDGQRLARPLTTPGMVQHETWTTSQAHLCIGMGCPGLDDPRRYAFWIIHTVLGDGMSSRLFQNIRERLGLTYSIYSSLELFRDAGWLTVYAACEKTHLDQVVALISHELNDLAQHGLTPVEIASAKTQLRGAVLLHHEGTVNRMTRLAQQEMIFGRLDEGLDETIAAVDRVTAAEITEACATFLAQECRHGVLLEPRSPKRHR
ncbi:MAG: insulinase family protein [Candidatus Latescibacteria bacterium]|nr:insulinase family protein [Candidatus Latescibacterota bacterium]